MTPGILIILPVFCSILIHPDAGEYLRSEVIVRIAPERATLYFVQYAAKTSTDKQKTKSFHALFVSYSFPAEVLNRPVVSHPIPCRSFHPFTINSIRGPTA